LKQIMAGLLAVVTLYSADDPIIEPSQRTDATFRLFRTQNIFKFLELDTRNGSLAGSMEFRREQQNCVADQLDAPSERVEAGAIYALSHKQHITFMLLDQELGNTWQVQWGLKPEERLIGPIEAWTEIAAQDARREQAKKPAEKAVPPPSTASKPKVVAKPPLPPK
jgi:hypothetical protein